MADRRTRTTSEVAEAVRVSLPSVSYQISVLRDGGLVTSRREGKYVLHAVTPLGLRLLGRSGSTGCGGRRSAAEAAQPPT